MPQTKSTVKRVSVKKRVRKNRVLNILREGGAMSRFDIAKATEYSPPVVTKLVDELIQDGFVRERGKGKSIGGRRPIRGGLREGGTLQDVLDASAALAEAERRTLRALINLNQAVTQVQRTTGTLLEASNVVFEEE